MESRRTKRRRRRLWIAPCALLTALGGGRAAAAEARASSLPLDFAAPAACIDADTFRARLAALPASKEKTEPPRAVHVRIVEREGTFRGELRVEHADGTATVREVASAHCDEVTSALEFVAALALGLDHAHDAAPPPSARQEPPPSPPSAPPPASSPPAAPSRWRVYGGLYAGLVSAAGPQVEFAPSVALGVMLDAPGLFAPELALSGTWAKSGAIATSRGDATLTLLEAALAACPVRLALGRGLALRPCAELQIGTLTATAEAANLLGPTTQSRPWTAAAALARAEWQLGQYVMIGAEGGAVFPFVYDRFFFTPGTDVYTVAHVGGAAKLGAAVMWP